MANGRNWTAEEIEQAIALYIVTPFGKLHQNNPNVINLAKRLDRTPGSIALKLVNLASIDETLDRKGMANASQLDKEVWQRSFERLFNSAASLNDQQESSNWSGFEEANQSAYVYDGTEGADVFTIKTARQGQQKFRRIVSANYENRCAITGISQTELLVAGHISPWAMDPTNRLNPRNGILMNRLHDKAFEEGLMVIGDAGEIIYTKKMDPEAKTKMKRLERNGYLWLPSKFRPDPELIRAHREAHLGK
ncbi:MAG: HNH endonuclease [Pseudomonadota bacterium]